MKCSLGISNFLEEISSLSHSVVFLCFFALISEEYEQGSLLAILWNSAFRCSYLSFSPLLFASLLFTAICKALLDSHALVIANTLSNNTREDYTWTSPDAQHQNQIDYILCSQRWRISIQSTKTRPGADCGSDHELLIAKIRLKLRK